MASINSDQYGDGVLRPGNGLTSVTLFGAVDIETAASASDTINFFTMPKGFTPLHGYVIGEDLDTNATETLDFDIGTAADPDYFGNFGIVTGDILTGFKPVTGIYLPLFNQFVIDPFTEVTEDTDVILTYNAAAATGGTGMLKVIMHGVMNDGRVID